MAGKGNLRASAQTRKTELPEVFRSKATIANAYGNIIYRTNTFGESVIIVPNFAPDVNERKLVNCRVKAKMLRSKFINDDVARKEFCIKVGNKIDSKATRVQACGIGVDAVLPFVTVGAEFVLRKEGDTYTTSKGEELTYTKTHYELNEESLVFFFGEHQKAFDEKDLEHFIRKSVAEDFEVSQF